MIVRNTLPSARLVAAAALALTAGAVRPAHAANAQVGDVFYIALENHNFTQPSTFTGLPQIQGNSAAPYINSLITPGNANAAQASYASNYTNAGIGEHPSEPNYIWAEAGTNFNPSSAGGTTTSTNQGPRTGTTVLNDNVPTAANNNLFSGVNHLTAQFNAAGVPWKNYQEDVQFTTPQANGQPNPQLNASGTSTTINPYSGSGQYDYAAKHNPMAFFTDTANQNLNPLAQLSTDLTNNTVGKYNWITPDQFNDMHSSLSTPYTYNGTTYQSTDPNSRIAVGDHFLSVLVPQIMASDAYKNNGAIVIWNDEVEGGDTTGFTSTEIVLSPLAKGNAFNSTVDLNHSSDIKTEEELYGLGSYLNNPIPSTETAANGVSYNTVAGSNDLSSLFVAGALPSSVPEPASLAVLGLGGLLMAGRRRRWA